MAKTAINSVLGTPIGTAISVIPLVSLLLADLKPNFLAVKISALSVDHY